MNVLNLFYEEPDEDRWLPLDRYARRLARRIIRGKPRVSGQKRVFLNLCAGLKKLGVAFRVNDYRYCQQHLGELACIIGKPCVLDKIQWRNPILFGASVFSHPFRDPTLFDRLPVKRVLVPGEWMRRMWEPYYGSRVTAWPVGIDTEEWNITPASEKSINMLVYDKIRWNHAELELSLLAPVRKALSERCLSSVEIRYGYYEEEEYRELLGKCQAMVFLCEHETQGIAYQQALSAGVPILAWDRGGVCCDPELLAAGVQFGPVSSVPYWDTRCGLKFASLDEFPEKLDEFLDRLNKNDFRTRDYIMENLTLEKCAKTYFRNLDECLK